MMSMTTTHVTIRVKELREGVFLATSEEVPGLTVECETRDEIIATAPEIALELFEVEAGLSGPGIWDQRGSWSVSRFVVLDGADDEEDTTEDRCGAEGKDRLGGAARAVECCGPGPAIRGASEPDLRLEEAASGAGGAGVRPWCRARC